MPIPPFLWLILVPLLSSPLVYIAGNLAYRQQRRSTAPYLSLVALLLTCAVYVQGILSREDPAYSQFQLGGLRLEADGLGMLLAGVVLLLGTMAVLFSWAYIARDEGQEKFYALLLAMIGVIAGLGFSTDLFNLWLWFEAMAVTSYLLVSFYRRQPACLEAGIKYLMQSACGSALILWGIAIVLAHGHSTSIDALRSLQGSPQSILTAVALFVIGFGVKASLVPLHTWLPDAHSQAPSGISAMLSGVVIEAGLIAMLRVITPLAARHPHVGLVIMVLSGANMLVGNLMALGQREVKRLLAYSSVAQVGYMLFGLGLTIYVGSPEGAQGGLFHLFNHGLMKGLAFFGTGTVLYAFYLHRGQHQTLMIEDLAGLSRRFPLQALGLSIGVLGLGGLPPLAGFMSKWQLLASGFLAHEPAAIALAAFAALNSVLSLGYYAPIVNTLYRQSPSANLEHAVGMPLSMTLPVVFLSLCVLAIGIWPSAVDWLTQPASAALMVALGK